MKINFKKIAAWFEDFLNRVTHKLPEVITQAAEFGLKYVKLAETFLTSNQVLDFAKLLPQAEPFRVQIMAILTELETAFKSVSGAFQKGTLLTASSQIGALKIEGIPVGHMILATQEVWLKQAA